MKLSAQMTFWASLVFALVCIAYGGFGFSRIDASMSDALREEARGFAWFWMFLGCVGALFAILAWLMEHGKFGPLDE
ncbi:MAG: hypothetical protein ABI585_01840 [Betaproteobacteria bacterium]